MSTPAQEYLLFTPGESVENALAVILRAATNTPVYTRFESDVNTTPRIELVLTLTEPTGNSYLRNPGNAAGQAQPFNSWQYTLAATVVTNRTTNGNQHVQLIGKTRYALQYFKLISSFTSEICPYHSITSIKEAGQVDAVADTDNCQLSTINFTGVLNIRDSAWPNA